MMAMMRMILIDAIQAPESIFTPKEIENAAEMIKKIGFVINPVVVKRVTVENYELVDGLLEIEAVRFLQKSDPLTYQEVNAFIAENDDQLAALEENINFFRRGGRHEF